MVIKSWNIDRYSYCCYVHIVGTVLYLIFIDGIVSVTRIILAKYIHTFGLQFCLKHLQKFGAHGRGLNNYGMSDDVD